MLSNALCSIARQIKTEEVMVISEKSTLTNLGYRSCARQLFQEALTITLQDELKDDNLILSLKKKVDLAILAENMEMKLYARYYRANNHSFEKYFEFKMYRKHLISLIGNLKKDHNHHLVSTIFNDFIDTCYLSYAGSILFFPIESR